jgi:hypothetical protein
MWIEWIVAWFIRIPNLDHKTKVALLLILKDPDWEITVKVNYLLQSVKELQKPSLKCN